MQPLRQNHGRGRRSNVVGLPAPYRGLNSRDRLEEAKPGYASILENFIPGNGEVTLRRGFTEWTTGLPAAVETLMEYAVGTTRTLFGASSTGIYDVTASGAVGAAAVSGLANARWSHTMYATTGGQYLVCCNGADGVHTYNGSWATSSITGATAANLIYVAAHKSRLWFVEKDTLKAWYLPTLAIASAAVEFNIGALCKHGGTLVAIEGWSVDAGDGADDYLAFVTSEGECLIYAGTDPASIVTWGLIGIYKTDRPIGRRCLQKFGADLFLLTESGVVSMAALLGTSSRWAQISELVRPDFEQAARLYSGTFGWQLVHYKRTGWLLINSPGETGIYGQFGYNSQIKAPDGWFTFSGMNARCWSELDGDLFFGGATSTFKADNGTSDNASEVTGDVQWAWSRMGTAAKKRFTLARPHMRSDQTPSPLMDMRVDYDQSPPSSEPTITSGTAGGDWDVATWDVDAWAANSAVYSQWAGITGIGHVGALRMTFSSDDTEDFAVIGVEINFETGGVL
jgi:hypothetical protein